MSLLTETYNPQNAKALSTEQIQAMQTFSDAEIAELAAAYPNQARGNSYLVLINTKLASKDQVYQLSTWANLRNLRNLNQKQFSAYSFESVFNNQKSPLVSQQGKSVAKIVDLSANTTGLPGLKSSGTTTNEITTPLVSTSDATTNEATTPLASTNEAVEQEQAKLDQLIEDKAHHMIVKAQQKKVDAARAAISSNQN